VYLLICCCSSDQTVKTRGQTTVCTKRGSMQVCCWPLCWRGSLCWRQQQESRLLKSWALFEEVDVHEFEIRINFTQRKACSAMGKPGPSILFVRSFGCIIIVIIIIAQGKAGITPSLELEVRSLAIYL